MRRTGEGDNIYFDFGWRVGEGDGGSGVYEVDLVGSSCWKEGREGREEDTRY